MTALSNWQSDNLAHIGAGKMPFGNRLLASQASLQENMDRHCERHIAKLDVHPPRADFINRTLFNETRQRSHTPSPTVSNAERGNDARCRTLSQPNNAIISTNGGVA